VRVGMCVGGVVGCERARAQDSVSVCNHHNIFISYLYIYIYIHICSINTYFVSVLQGGYQHLGTARHSITVCNNVIT